MQVRALARGYYGLKRRKIGEVFSINDPKDLGSWMEPLEPVDPSVPAKRAKRGDAQPPRENVL